MFGNLFGQKEKEIPIRDLVWMNQEAKVNGGITFLTSQPDAIIVSWFQKTMQEWSEHFAAIGLNRTIHIARSLHVSQTENKTIVVIDHYPLFSKEHEAVQNWKAREVIVLNALDDGLMKYFGGDKIVSMMEKMGMAESEIIEHKMVTASIKTAQQKLDKKVTNELLADSQEEWFNRNFI